MIYLYQLGATMIRVPFYWESYELNPSAFISDLLKILETAKKYKIKVILDNHQWETGSWLGWGIGFPDSVLGVYPKKGGEPNYANVRNFWERFWLRLARDINGVDVWKRMGDFLEGIISIVGGHESLLMFEILNEPEVWRNEDYGRIKAFYDYMIPRVRNRMPSWKRNVAICWALPRGSATDTAGQHTSYFPTFRNNLIYDCHAYPPSSFRVSYFKAIVSALPERIPLWFGEFNSGFSLQGGQGATLSKEQVYEYVQRFKSEGMWGWSLWRWNYYPDNNIPAFNMNRINSQNRIEPNAIYYYVRDAIRDIKP